MESSSSAAAEEQQVSRSAERSAGAGQITPCIVSSHLRGANIIPSSVGRSHDLGTEQQR